MLLLLGTWPIALPRVLVLHDHYSTKTKKCKLGTGDLNTQRVCVRLCDNNREPNARDVCPETLPLQDIQLTSNVTRTGDRQLVGIFYQGVRM